MIRNDEYYALMEQERVCLVNLLRKRALEGPRRRCEGIIKLQLIERNRESVG